MMNEKAAIEEAVKSRLSLLRAFTDKNTGRIICFDLMNVLMPLLENALLFGQGVPRVTENKAQEIRQHYIDVLTHVPTFVLAEDECRSLETIHRTYPDTKVYLSDFVPPDKIMPVTGFMYFANPLDDPTEDREPLAAIHAISWVISKNGDTPIHLLSIDDDSYLIELTIYFKTNGTLKAEIAPRLYPGACVAWGMDLDDGGRFSMDPEEEELATMYRHAYVKVFLAAIAVIRQKSFEAGEPRERLHKKVTDRVKHVRKQHPGLTNEIQVIRYRPKKSRTTKPSSNPTGRTQKVRSWVSPFWRRQICGKGRKEHKPMIVWAFQRGPEGGEEVGQERVFRTPRPLKTTPLPSSESQE
jgi:hypothetical protein